MSRRAELAANLESTRERIATACESAGRSIDDVHLIVVTKTYPASDVALLAELGVRDIGENRHPEAGRKAEEVADPSLRWHFVGALQTNKANQVARYADVVHSVDRVELAEKLGRGAELAGRTLTALVQVRLADTEGRAGAPAEQVATLADVIASQPHLELGGVMGVAPLGEDPRPSFDALRGLSEVVRTVEARATMISAGMSEDLEAAVAAGATHLRIGRAILGERPASSPASRCAR